PPAAAGQRGRTAIGPPRLDGLPPSGQRPGSDAGGCPRPALAWSAGCAARAAGRVGRIGRLGWQRRAFRQKLAFSS
ncbi:hypothetical protein, partial [Paenibacillus pasadenensis]|uniref:hypothetical protein n=1 Tax=Paenibacillus pasadenensis TaxID=217090 RepID=UPI001C3FB092